MAGGSTAYGRCLSSPIWRMPSPSGGFTFLPVSAASSSDQGLLGLLKPISPPPLSHRWPPLPSGRRPATEAGRGRPRGPPGSGPAGGAPGEAAPPAALAGSPPALVDRPGAGPAADRDRGAALDDQDGGVAG